jgi:X-Pro dipeptidyl-peptidase (S15 family)
MLVRHGYGVLLFDRRGEGESEGDWNVFGWQGERDLYAAAGFLRSRDDVDPERIGGIGRSVGGEMHCGQLPGIRDAGRDNSRHGGVQQQPATEGSEGPRLENLAAGRVLHLWRARARR